MTALVQEKLWIILGLEFGADLRNKSLIVRALYGLKSAGSYFRDHLDDCMKTSSTSHVWMILTSGTKQKSELMGMNSMHIFYVTWKIC